MLQQPFSFAAMWTVELRAKMPKKMPQKMPKVCKEVQANVIYFLIILDLKKNLEFF
jgi:hypothetical protein